MADQINVNPGSSPERVVETDGGISGLAWVVLVLIVLVIGWFLFAGRGDTDNTTAPADNAGTTEQPGGTADDGSNNDGTTDGGTGDAPTNP